VLTAATFCAAPVVMGVRVPGNTLFVSAAVGYQHLAALSRDGELFT